MGVDIIDEHNHKKGGHCANNDHSTHDHGTHVAALAGGHKYGIATEAMLLQCTCG